MILVLLGVSAVLAAELFVALVGRDAVALVTMALALAAATGPPERRRLPGFLVLEAVALASVAPVVMSGNRRRSLPALALPFDAWGSAEGHAAEPTPPPGGARPRLATRHLPAPSLPLADRWLLNPEPPEKADAGGFSDVYLAEDLWQPDRTVLVKLQSRAPGVEAQSRARLRREHQMLGQLRSPHIIRLHDGGEDPHTRLWYLVLDYHPVGSLARRIPEVFVTDLRWVADVVIGLLKAVTYLHAEAPRPLIHRDVSARNVLLGEQRSRSILIDLGSARYLGGADPSNDLPVTTGPLYSRYYSPPEMVIPSMLHAWGPATDVYGVAAILYELLTGLPPYQREERRSGRPFEQLVADPTRGPMPARRLHHQLPLGLDVLLGACLASEPGARPSAAQMLDFMMAVRQWHGNLRVPLWDLRQLRP